MQYYKDELTQEHIDLARSNGIDYNTLWKRYNYYDYSLEAATTMPKYEREESEHKSYIDDAHVNGICRSTYLTRVRGGMSKEEASTKPVVKRGRPKGTHHTCRPYTEEQLQQAISNGISRQALNGRLKRKWDLERAITEPPREWWTRNTGEKAQLFVSRKQRSPKKVVTKKEKFFVELP
ncbi:hypothetical protein OCB07_15840 [Bacillus cereus]|nr:hypothetical protein [Bacillus cereus]